ncbi:hypothetical protein [Paludisphaera mucosa]|uniref:Uncharacterized protein n=1 Tax=Paludisphaera mucosa TaxID=3030827 RepID=A0ABT6FI83_9BACT|nr:hypothetical protein [Paludisphaera mucosa]MDG3007249.1 hypothetical protein [Paludisphaera mucosa]
MPPRKNQNPRPTPPIVVYAPLGELKVYELSEAEFERLAEGPTGQLHLNFALAMLPTALSILVTLQTATIESNRIYTSYLVAFWLLLVQGLISLFRWWHSNRSHQKLIDDIRARMPKRPGIAEQMPSTTVLLEPGPVPAIDAQDSPPDAVE